MPNHVTNRIIAPKEVLESCIVKDEEGNDRFDFSLVVPIPDVVNQEEMASEVETLANIALGLLGDLSIGETTGDGLDSIIDGLERGNARRQLLSGRTASNMTDAEFETFVKYMKSYRETGHTHWFPWNRTNWGTKWNAYSFKRISETEIEFKTAWNAPHPVIEKLAKNTEKIIRHEWADEDTGRNVGFRIYRKGEIEKENELSNTKEGYELAFKLHPGYEESYELVDGEYKYKED